MANVLVIIESPFQLINANEYTLLKGIDPKKIDYIFLTIKSENNLLQLRSTFSTLNLVGKVHEITVTESYKGGLIKKLTLLKKIKASLKNIKKKKYTEIVLGHILSNYQLMLANGSNAKCIFVDDGRESYKGTQLLGKKKINSFLSSNKVLIYKLFGLNVRLRYDDEFLFFTIYDDLIKKHDYLKFEKNDLSSIKINIGNKPVDNNVIYFVDSNMVPAIIDFETFVKNLNFVNNYYNKKGKRIVYFPHRERSNESLNVVRSLNWEIKETGVPIEITLLTLEYLPFEFSMFFTSAMNSISTLVDNVHFRSFKLTSSDLLGKQHIIDLYMAYEANDKVEIIEIE